MIRAVKLQYGNKIDRCYSYKDIIQNIITEYIDCDDIKEKRAKSIYIFTNDNLEEAIHRGKELLTYRLIHARLEDIQLLNSSVFRYVNKRLVQSDISEMNRLMITNRIETVNPSDMFLDIKLDYNIMQYYFISNPRKPVWSLFFPTTQMMKKYVSEIPNNNLMYTNKTLHPLIVKILNSVVRHNRDYLCIITLENNIRKETLERIAFYDQVGTNIDILCRIILNDI